LAVCGITLLMTIGELAWAGCYVMDSDTCSSVYGTETCEEQCASYSCSYRGNYDAVQIPVVYCADPEEEGYYDTAPAGYMMCQWVWDCKITKTRCVGGWGYYCAMDVYKWDAWTTYWDVWNWGCVGES